MVRGSWLWACEMKASPQWHLRDVDMKFTYLTKGKLSQDAAAGYNKCFGVLPSAAAFYKLISYLTWNTSQTNALLAQLKYWTKRKISGVELHLWGLVDVKHMHCVERKGFCEKYVEVMNRNWRYLVPKSKNRTRGTWLSESGVRPRNLSIHRGVCAPLTFMRNDKEDRDDSDRRAWINKQSFPFKSELFKGHLNGLI